MQRYRCRASIRVGRKVLRKCHAEWLQGVPLQNRKAVRSGHLKFGRDWRIILFVLFLCAVACLAAEYIVLKFPP